MEKSEYMLTQMVKIILRTHIGIHGQFQRIFLTKLNGGIFFIKVNFLMPFSNWKLKMESKELFTINTHTKFLQI